MNGVIIVDKPLRKTSFDMIRDIRKEYNIKKVGHIGTLDPMATGVLPVLVGEATKLSDYLMEHDKEYVATLFLGEKRDTGDSEGKVIETKEIPEDMSVKKIVEVLNSFLGESMQIPPMYSAIKVNGKKLYDLAREGKTIERAPRKVKIDEIELLGVMNDNKIIKFRVVCSKGTYIRVLCEDIAEKLGTVGYMKSLRRTRVGNFGIEDAGKIIEMKDILVNVPKIEIDKIEIKVNVSKIEQDKITRKVDEFQIKSSKMDDMKKHCTNSEIMKKLENGVAIQVNEKDGLVNLYKGGDFIGIGQVKNGILKRKIII